MVQRQISLQSKDPMPFTQGGGWHAENKHRFHSSQQYHAPLSANVADARSMTIEAALRDCGGLPVKEFALIALLDNGREEIYTSRALASNKSRIFSERSRRVFHRVANKVPFETDRFGSRHQNSEKGSVDCSTDEGSRKLSSDDEFSSYSHSRMRVQKSRTEQTEYTSIRGKRKRARQYSSAEADDTAIPVPVLEMQQLTIGNDAEVEAFYTTRFKDMQQSACKVMGKAFVKLIEPKKQTHHPYTGGDDKAPPWWPKATGENYVRHREPDHLLRPARIRLLVHILNLIIEPYQLQCPAVQRLRLNVQKLEEATMEAMSVWFNEPDHPDNLKKKPFLKEMFKVAKAQERYKNGEIDGETRVPVICGDNRGAEGGKDEDEDDGLHGDEVEPLVPQPTIQPMSTPESLMSPQMAGPTPLLPQTIPEQEHNNMYNDSTRPLPLRYLSQTALNDSPPFSNPAYVPRAVDNSFQSSLPNPSESGRRQFGSPVYANAQGMFAWQNPTISSHGNMDSTYYTTSAQSSFNSQTGPYQLPPPASTQHQGLPPMGRFDEFSSARQFDIAPPIGSVLRHSSMYNSQNISHGFPPFMHDNSNAYVQNNTIMRNEH